jgi:hypothetical protein
MKATPWDPEKLASYDLRRSVPSHVVEIINTPHDHEGDGNKPLWIIWKHVEGFPPVIDTLCDTADSAVYHYGMLASEIEQHVRLRNKGTITVNVERVPANHRFASSINDVFTSGTFTAIKPSSRNGYRYKRDGD